MRASIAALCRAPAAAWGLALVVLCMPIAALAQPSMAACRAELGARPAAQLRACEEHAGCRQLVRIIDSCPGLATFLELLAAQGRSVDDSSLRRALVEAGVPPNGLALCTSEFNRALCRNFLSLEDASGETAAGPSRGAQFQESLRRLVEQQERARVPEDAHRQAELKLAACAAARLGPERDSACREAMEAVQTCEVARQQWAQRREVLLVDAERAGQREALRTLRALEMPSCAQTLPGSTLTPQQALIAANEAGGASDAPPPAAPAAAPAAAAPAAAAPAPAPAPGAAAAPRPDNGDCKASLRRMEERFEVIQRRRPAEPPRLATLQVEIYMLTEQVGVLERLCRGQREYDFLKPTQERLAGALQNCRASAANPVNDCIPRVAW